MKKPFVAFWKAKMPWIDKSPHVKPRKAYDCDSCGQRFVWREEGDPKACALCGAPAGEIAYQPPLPALTTNRSRAIDYAQHIAEVDYGLSDMNDGGRAGDIAAKGPPPVSTAEREQIIREVAQYAEQTQQATSAIPEAAAQAVRGFWQAGSSGTQTPEQAMQASAPGAAQARREGSDPIELLKSAPAPRIIPIAQTKAVL